jgi:uncharacterized membrane protein YphA (DoxX/SURF4 family)
MASQTWHHHHPAQLPVGYRDQISVTTQVDTSTSLLFLGRVILGGYFLYNGLQHFMNHALMSSSAAAAGVPAPAMAVGFSGIMLVVGGLSLIAGYYPKIGAGCLAVFLITVTPVMHGYWNDPPGPEYMTNFVNFTKNVALLGGVCFAAAVPEPWPFSVGRKA